MKIPKVTVMIATFNSGKLLGRTLDAIVSQTYPREYLEILIIDGGSSDNTREIATEYGCRIVDNPKKEPINAKLIGMREATGKYLITIDHDEVIQNRKSIENKVKALIENPECKVALCSGYQCPKDYSRLNQYISEFGDPFSLFVYRFPKGYKFFEKELRKDYKLVKDNDIYSVFSFEKMEKQPIFELCCLGTMIDREYFLQFPGVCEDGKVFIHLFYHMLDKGCYDMVLLKRDPLVHYSADALERYLPKIKWRICNNVHHADMGSSGFSGRQQYGKGISHRKYLFIPYTVATIPAVIEGIYLSLTRRNYIYMLHPYLCWYTLIQIVYQYGLKLTGHSPELMSYDGKENIKM